MCTTVLSETQNQILLETKTKQGFLPRNQTNKKTLLPPGWWCTCR